MFATPIRWILMLCVAASGYFMITNSDMYVRAAAFIGSVVCWQFYYVIMMYEADLIRTSGMKKKERSAADAQGRIAPQPDTLV